MITRSILVGSLVVLAACGQQAASARTATLTIAGRSVTLPDAGTGTGTGTSRAAEFSSAPRITTPAAMPVAPTPR